MKKCALAVMVFTGLALSAQAAEETRYRQIQLVDYRDHLQGGWIGQMAGVGWGSPTEMKSCGRIMQEAEMPPRNLKMVNQHRNDDIYVELSFVRTLELHGFDVSAKQAGIDFANTGFPLFIANFLGRSNVRCGIAPPDSGHPRFTNKVNDLLDYQIESDYAGLISPGCPNSVIALGDKFGHMMCYGDGVYGGQFVRGMYAEAYFEMDVIKVIEAGLKCIPTGSQYAEMVRDMLAWYRQDPQNWEKTWVLVEEKYLLCPLVLATDAALNPEGEQLQLNSTDINSLTITPEPASGIFHDWTNAQVFRISSMGNSALLAPIATAGSDPKSTCYRVWLPFPTQPGANLAVGGTESVSRTRNPGAHVDPRAGRWGSIIDGGEVLTYNNTKQDQDWYAVTLAKPATVGRVVFLHSWAFPSGGWFDNYEIALRRWPEEANAAICGTVPAWDSVLGDYPLPAGKAFPIVKARLTVGEFKGENDVTSSDTAVSFSMPLKQGQTMLRGTFLDDQGKEICGTYYVSVRYLANVP